MKSSTKRVLNGKGGLEDFRRELWGSIHRGPPLPINHPIPRLNPPLRSRWALAKIDDFVRSRVASGLAACALLVGLCTGCSTVTYTSPGGERFSRSALGAATALTSLEVEAGTNGLRKVSLRGYRNDSSDALGTVTEAAVRAAIRN